MSPLDHQPIRSSIRYRSEKSRARWEVRYRCHGTTGPTHPSRSFKTQKEARAFQRLLASLGMSRSEALVHAIRQGDIIDGLNSDVDEAVVNATNALLIGAGQRPLRSLEPEHSRPSGTQPKRTGTEPRTAPAAHIEGMSVLDHSCASLPARLTKEELSAYLGITPELLGVHTRAGKISATKLGRQWVYSSEDVRAYLAASQNARACAALTDKYGLFTGRESALVAHLPDLVQIQEASQFLGFTSEYVNDLCLGHLLAAVKVGRSWLIPRSGLAAFLYARTAHA